MHMIGMFLSAYARQLSFLWYTELAILAVKMEKNGISHQIKLVLVFRVQCEILRC